MEGQTLTIIGFLLTIFGIIINITGLFYPEELAYFLRILKNNRQVSKKKLLYKYRAQMITNNVILLDISEVEFSKVAANYLKDKSYKRLTITNIREPSWFFNYVFERVSSEFSSDKTPYKTIKFLHDVIIGKENADVNYVRTELRKLTNEFYNKNENTIEEILPHLKPFNNREIDKKNKVRVNFFKVFINNTDANTNTFIKNNHWVHLIFFEDFINYNVTSVFCDISNSNSMYLGEDSLILDNKIVLNHDEYVKELNFQNHRHPIDKVLSHGFYQEILSKKENYLETKIILEKLYHIAI